MNSLFLVLSTKGHGLQRRHMKMTTTIQHASWIRSGGMDGVLQIEEGARNGALKSYTQKGGV